jgi:zinc/manganese transport system substrate-binding protein
VHKLIIGGLLGLAIALSAAHADPVKIVAAENFYGDIAQQIGGNHVAVTSILTNPDQDPHEFEASASTAREIADARLVVYSGADYDPWALKLLSASKSPSREIIEVAKLVHKKSGDNPHVWYEPNTMPVLAKAVAAVLSRIDPDHQADYSDHLASFEQSMKPLADRVVALRKAYAGAAVTATEPVFGYMADALGLKMRNGRFQLAVMNDTEPSATAIAAFEKDLRTRAVRALFYNSQTSEALTERMRKIAEAAGVPVIGVTETEPPGQNYQAWMLSQLDALDRALSQK